MKTVHLWQSDPDSLPMGKGCGSLVFLLGRFPVPGVPSECSSGSLMECGFLPCREWAFLPLLFHALSKHLLGTMGSFRE